MNKKCIVLLSGGLDSILVVKLMLDQGIEVQALTFSAKLCMCGSKKTGKSAAVEAAEMLGVPLEIVDFTPDFMEIIKNPRYGHGANMNPCIDCKIYMQSRARGMLDKFGASFIVTGEVLGERPMSQRKDALLLIEKRAGVKGILLRPLSAKLLEPTIPEKEGIVDREKLLDISGRSRKPQMELAAKLGIKKYPQPAGGCLLTDEVFARRVKEAMAEGEFEMENVAILSVGRQFRPAKGARLIVGRDEAENDLIESLARPGDTFIKMAKVQGPLSLLRGSAAAPVIEMASAIAAHHTKSKNEERVSVNIWQKDGEKSTITVIPAKREEIEKLRI